MRAKVSMRKALSDPTLLGSVLVGDSWKAARVLLIAAMGEELTEDERTLFTAAHRREHEPLASESRSWRSSSEGAAAKAGASRRWPATSPGCASIRRWSTTRSAFLS